MTKEVEVEDDLTIQGPTVRERFPGRTESPLGNAAVAQDDSSVDHGHRSTDLDVKDPVERYDASADLGHAESSTDCSEIYINPGLIAHAPSALPVRKGPVDHISHSTDLGHAESSALRSEHLKTSKPSDFVAESSAVPASKGPVRASTHAESSAVHSAFTKPSSPVRARASAISISDLVPHGSPSKFVAAFTCDGGFVVPYCLPTDPPADDSDDELLAQVITEENFNFSLYTDDELPTPSEAPLPSTSSTASPSLPPAGTAADTGASLPDGQEEEN